MNAPCSSATPEATATPEPSRSSTVSPGVAPVTNTCCTLPWATRVTAPADGDATSSTSAATNTITTVTPMLRVVPRRLLVYACSPSADRSSRSGNPAGAGRPVDPSRRHPGF